MEGPEPMEAVLGPTAVEAVLEDQLRLLVILLIWAHP